MTEALTLREHSKKDTNELIHHSNHCLFITSRLRELPFKILPEPGTPLNNTHSHLEKDISQMWITLLRNTPFHHHLSRLLNNRISACIFNNLLPAIKPPDIPQLSYESTSKFRGDAGNRRDNQDFKRKKRLTSLAKSLESFSA